MAGASIIAGVEGLALSRLGSAVIWIVADEQRIKRVASSLAFFAPERERIEFPAYDCLPYDRFSPSLLVASERASALARLTQARSPIVIASMAAVMQKVPPHCVLEQQRQVIEQGTTSSWKGLRLFLEQTGYRHVDIVASCGEYAHRGSVMDIYPPSYEYPVRVDFFGDEVEEMRSFDPETQRSLQKMDKITLLPTSEIFLTKDKLSAFQTNWATQFGFASSEDRDYAAVIAGQHVQGMEHYLPLFYSHSESLFDYVPSAQIVCDENVLAVLEDHWATITTCYEGRCHHQEKALAPSELYLDRTALEEMLSHDKVMHLSSFAREDQLFPAQKGRDFALARQSSDVD